eukprot:CAMPEP_0206005028 /NCGR_PEP_ID=MMETSP1464-20131121/4336_1 /ASSEMBLY_ACC=CAM_ASM_001124 /TAXON_ID=119497 /ORGANISM="Exanthemachrysis gayraliae, Strain RCC1523" /LENGTH=99 /DNA_ID=CAMNT_0053378449 /DNA_START=27 /DNA_END=322 /DNA_ORIENTATION=+
MGSDAKDKGKKDGAKEEAAPAAAPAPKEEDVVLSSVVAQLALIERSVGGKDPKPMSRVMRQATAIRRRARPAQVAEAAGVYLPDGNPAKKPLLEALAQV